MDPDRKLRTRCWKRRILILLSLTILELIGPAGSAEVTRPERLLHIYGCRFIAAGTNPLTGIESLTADGHGNFTSGTLFFTFGVVNGTPLTCKYNLVSGTYLVNLDNTGSSNMIWTLNSGSAGCPAGLTIPLAIVLEDVEKHNVATQFDWVELDQPISGVCVQQ